MAHLAAGPRLALAVEVEVRGRIGEDLAPSRPPRRRPDCAISTRGAVRSVAPSGRPQIARIWFSNCEVARALDRPVAAIVDARRHLVEHRLAADGEKLERQHADIVERVGDPRGQRLGLGDCAGRAPAPAGTLEATRMPPSWRLRGAVPEHDLAVRAAAEQDREFGIEARPRPRGSHGAPRDRRPRPPRPRPGSSIRAWPLPS